jgi:predicted NBD/HSP70 family sugar kinase
MDVINEGIEVLGISSDNIVGVGMGVPGLIDINRNVITHIPRLPCLYESQIAKRIEDEMGIRVYVCNDVKLIALADSQVADANYENMLYVAYRCGIGMAILHKQDIYNGEYGNSGYLGHTTIDPAGDLCSCGNHGCLELYCSRAVLIKKYNGMGTDHIDTFGELLALADDGSRDAQEVLGWGGRYLGIAIANAVKLFDISVVMIGDLCDNMECYYFKVIKQAVKDCTIYMGDRDITFLLGSNEEDNYAIGGCRFVIEKFFRSPKLRLQSNE